MNKINPEEKIILAIDGLDIHQAKVFLKRCPNIKWVKVGLELFTREGPNVIKILKNLNKRIFLDLKFHDIPNTMSAACYEVSKLGVDIISVHASAGSKALTASKKASLEGAKIATVNAPCVIGITVLTSLSSEEFQTDLDRKISIEDDGSGYSRDVLSKIGEPYLRSNDPIEKSKTGLGLGIFIGKTLLEKNFASIICRNSKTRSGAEVIIRWKIKDLINI